MSDSHQESASIPNDGLGDNLPPVQPPSAGFIIQLFVFPALIVMAVVAIWWMFGLIAVGEQDWRKLSQDMQSQNLHIRNRAMYGLAQVLEQDLRRGDQGHHLATNHEIAQAATDQLNLELRKNSSSKEGVAIQVYLTRLVGMLDAIEVTAPALISALEPQRDVEIRKSAIVSISLIAGRAFERQHPLTQADLVQALIALSNDSEPVLNHSAAFALGLMSGPEAIQQLEVLTQAGDQLTRVNAAVGLARHGSTKGYSVLRDSLKLPEPKAPITSAPGNSKTTPAETIAAEAAAQNAINEQVMVVKNVLKGISELATKLDHNQRSELLPLLIALSNHHPEIRIRIDAEQALNAIKAAEKTS